LPIGLNPTGATEPFEKVVTAINRHDIEVLTSLMTADHLFIDTMGNRGRVAESMQTGWCGYFAMCSDLCNNGQQDSGGVRYSFGDGRGGRHD
jgi:ketosteroid isomerase-like protein